MQTRSMTRNRITRSISVDLPQNVNRLRSTRSSSDGAVSENFFVRLTRSRENVLNDLSPVVEENDTVCDVSIEQNNDLHPIQINIGQNVLNNSPLDVEKNDDVLQNNDLHPIQINIGGNVSNDLPLEENDDVLQNNDGHPIQINIGQPVIVLERLNDDFINLHRGVNAISSQSSFSSQFSQSSTEFEPLVFTRFEFIFGTKSNTRLLFVHDIEHLYFLRSSVKNGTIYACRNRKKCNAKVIIDASGACKQYGTESHTHPSVAEDFANLLVMRKSIRSVRNSMFFDIKLFAVYLIVLLLSEFFFCFVRLVF